MLEFLTIITIIKRQTMANVIKRANDFFCVATVMTFWTDAQKAKTTIPLGNRTTPTTLHYQSCRHDND